MEDLEKRASEFSVPVTMNLGAVELTVKDLISIRPGTKIHFEKPSLFNGTLQAGGRDWAVVTINLEGDSVVIGVENILGETIQEAATF